MDPDLGAAVLRFCALLPALTLHEFAHAYSAYRFGDPTPKLERRVSLNPLNHLDPLGTLMILLGPVGWGKPVHVNPYNMRDPARHYMITTACGPLSNLIQGLVFGLLVRAAFGPLSALMVVNHRLWLFLRSLVLIPFALAFFNLIPLGVLDGHEVFGYFLPFRARVAYEKFNHTYGMLALIGLIALPALTGVDIIGHVLRPAWFLTNLLAG